MTCFAVFGYTRGYARWCGMHVCRDSRATLMNCTERCGVCLFQFKHRDHCQLRYWLFLYYFNLDLCQKAPPLPQY